MKIESSAAVLGLGGSNSLGVVRSLGHEEISVDGFHMGRRKPNAHLSKYIGEVKFCRNQKELVKNLIDYGKKRDKKSVLFPTGDDYILFCSDYEKELSPYFHVPHSSRGNLSTLIEKETNSSIALGTGFEIPSSRLLTAYEVPVEREVIVKPLSSVIGGKRDMIKYDSDKEMLSKKSKLINIYGDMLVQEFIPGDNKNLFEVHAYKSSNGVIIAGMQQSDVAIQANPFVYMGVIFKDIWDDSLIGPSKNLADKLDFNGALDINLKKSSKSGKFYLMEVNLRTSANLTLDNINLPAIIYKDLNGKDFSDLLTNRKNLEKNRWLHELRINRFLNQGGSPRKIKDKLSRIRANAFYDPEDLGPFSKKDLEKSLSRLE